MMDTNSTQYYLDFKWNFQHFAKNFLSFPIPWDSSRFPQNSNSIMPIKQLTSACRVYEVSRTCVKSKVKHQLVLRWLKTNDKLQSMTRSPCSICQYCNGDVEGQDWTKMYLARDPIGAKNLVREAFKKKTLKSLEIFQPGGGGLGQFQTFFWIF